MFAQQSGGRHRQPSHALYYSVLLKLLGMFLPRERNSNSALPFPQLSQVSAGCDGRLHILHRDPFERAMRVMLTAEQVGGRQSKLCKARTIGATSDDVVIRFESSGREGLSCELNRAHILAQPVSHVAILFADFAANARPRL